MDDKIVGLITEWNLGHSYGIADSGSWLILLVHYTHTLENRQEKSMRFGARDLLRFKLGSFCVEAFVRLLRVVKFLSIRGKLERGKAWVKVGRLPVRLHYWAWLSVLGDEERMMMSGRAFVDTKGNWGHVCLACWMEMEYCVEHGNPTRDEFLVIYWPSLSLSLGSGQLGIEDGKNYGKKSTRFRTGKAEGLSFLLSLSINLE